MNCPRCQRVVQEGLNACPFCGQPLMQPQGPYLNPSAPNPTSYQNPQQFQTQPYQYYYQLQLQQQQQQQQRQQQYYQQQQYLQYLRQYQLQQQWLWQRYMQQQMLAQQQQQVRQYQLQQLQQRQQQLRQQQQQQQQLQAQLQQRELHQAQAHAQAQAQAQAQVPAQAQSQFQAPTEYSPPAQPAQPAQPSEPLEATPKEFAEPSTLTEPEPELEPEPQMSEALPMALEESLAPEIFHDEDQEAETEPGSEFGAGQDQFMPPSSEDYQEPLPETTHEYPGELSPYAEAQGQMGPYHDGPPEEFMDQGMELTSEGGEIYHEEPPVTQPPFNQEPLSPSGDLSLEPQQEQFAGEDYPGPEAAHVPQPGPPTEPVTLDKKQQKKLEKEKKRIAKHRSVIEKKLKKNEITQQQYDIAMGRLDAQLARFQRGEGL